jgi:DNA-directed RNA polymerase subunit F
MACLLCVVLLACSPLLAQHNTTPPPSQSHSAAPAPTPAAPPSPATRAFSNPGNHLGTWLENHKNLSLSDQERALEHEPGFNRLTPQQQENLRNRLRQLNAMPPAERQRTIDHIEAMERLTPDQRQQVRGAMTQLRALPLERRQAVAQAFSSLRQFPADQRMKAADTYYGDAFNPQEREALNSLLRAEPYLPLSRRPPQYGALPPPGSGNDGAESGPGAPADK